jgi:hypothetical protein
MAEYIYYNGLGANKSGKHTVKEFLEIMNTKFGISCSDSLLTQLTGNPGSPVLGAPAVPTIPSGPSGL